VRFAPLILVAAALGAGGCGSGSKAVPGVGGSSSKASASAPAAVIRGWSDALRGGDIDRASGYFAVPSLVENGSPPVELNSVGEVKIFNVAFRITHGKIAEWRRAAGYPGEDPSSAPPAGNNFT
jgi:hypothetical protein